MNNNLMNLFEKIMKEVVESLQCQDLCKDPKQCCDTREQCCLDPKQDNKDLLSRSLRAWMEEAAAHSKLHKEDPKQCCDTPEQCCPDPKQDNNDCCETTCCQDVECGTLLHPKFYDNVRKELQDLNRRITGLMGYVHDQTCCKVEPLSCEILNDQLIAMLEYQLALTERLVNWPRN